MPLNEPQATGKDMYTHASWPQHAPNLCKRVIEVLDMLEDLLAEDAIERSVIKRESVGR